MAVAKAKTKPRRPKPGRILTRAVVDPVVWRNFVAEVYRRGERIEDRIGTLVSKDCETMRRETVAASR